MQLQQSSNRSNNTKQHGKSMAQKGRRDGGSDFDVFGFIFLGRVGGQNQGHT